MKKKKIVPAVNDTGRMSKAATNNVLEESGVRAGADRGDHLDSLRKRKGRLHVDCVSMALVAAFAVVCLVLHKYGHGGSAVITGGAHRRRRLLLDHEHACLFEEITRPLVGLGRDDKLKRAVVPQGSRRLVQRQRLLILAVRRHEIAWRLLLFCLTQVAFLKLVKPIKTISPSVYLVFGGVDLEDYFAEDFVV